MNSLQLHCSLHFNRPKHSLLRCSTLFTPRTCCHFPGKISFREISRGRANDAQSFTRFAQSETKELGADETSSEKEEHERPPFDINLAVILAGFAFESYATPPENIGKREVNAAGCNTLYLS